MTNPNIGSLDPGTDRCGTYFTFVWSWTHRGCFLWVKDGRYHDAPSIKHQEKDIVMYSFWNMWCISYMYMGFVQSSWGDLHDCRVNTPQLMLNYSMVFWRCHEIRNFLINQLVYEWNTMSSACFHSIRSLIFFRTFHSSIKNWVLDLTNGPLSKFSGS